MTAREKNCGYSSNRKYIRGAGFTDVMTCIGSYVSQIKDLIAKPLLGTVGNLAAMDLTEGGKALLSRIINNKN